MENTKPISDNSSLNISLPMIIQAVTFVVMLVWGYSQLNARISFLEYQVAMNESHIEDIEEDAEANQDAERSEVLLSAWQRCSRNSLLDL